MKIQLRSGPYQLTLDPALGGAVRSFAFHGHDILRASPDTDDVLQSSGFPMVPYSGRVAQARFDWRGGTVRLPENFPPEPHAIHGTGWRAAWEVEERRETRAVLTHSPDPAEWPWSCTARQVFELGEDGLSLDMSVTNDSNRDMPAGLGWHPYFVRRDAMLETATASMWANDAGGVSARKVAPPDGLDSKGARDVDGLDLDNAFDVEAVDATVRWPGTGLTARLVADATFRNLVIYTPRDEPFFCVEPASHAPDALNTHPDGPAAMDVLSPGKALRGVITLSATLPATLTAHSG